MPTYTKDRNWHARYLDSLRGIAVLLVLMVHAGLSCALTPRWAVITFSGQRGVQLFFLVSAFTLSLSHDQRSRIESRPTRNFFLRRFFRLAPMYYLDIVLTALLAPAVLGTLRDRLLGIFFLQGFTPESNLHVIPGGWTLGVEGLFYCCLPFLLRQIRSLKSALLYLCLATPLLMTGSWWLNHRLHDIHEEYLTLYWFPIELPVFLLGVTIYFLWKEKVADNVRIKENARIISLSLLAVAAAIYVKNLPLDNHRLYFSTTGYGFLLLAVAIHPWRLLVNRVTVFIGKISFSIYLLHFWFLPLAVRYTLPLAHSMSPVQLFVLRFFLTLLPTGVLATLTWFYIEETGIRLGRRFIAWLEDRPLRQPATVPSLAEEWRTDRASGRDEQF